MGSVRSCHTGTARAAGAPGAAADEAAAARGRPPVPTLRSGSLARQNTGVHGAAGMYGNASELLNASRIGSQSLSSSAVDVPQARMA